MSSDFEKSGFRKQLKGKSGCRDSIEIVKTMNNPQGRVILHMPQEKSFSHISQGA